MASTYLDTINKTTTTTTTTNSNTTTTNSNNPILLNYETRKAELIRQKLQPAYSTSSINSSPRQQTSASSPTYQHPEGWAAIKLRKVYLKEYQDRKDGLDEEDILSKRYQRELQVCVGAGGDICVDLYM